VKQIISLVKQGHLKPGDKLPPERNIAEQLGVSRPTVREALSALELLGLLETKTGQGSFVCSTDLEGLESRLVTLFGEERSPFEVFETRRGIEAFAAGMAAQRATPQALSEIEKALRTLSDQVTRDGIWNDELDKQFHLALVAASGNSVLLDVATVLLDMSRRTLWFRLKEQIQTAPGSSEKYLEEHQQIYEAIRDGDAEQASAVTFKHFLNAEQAIIKLGTNDPQTHFAPS
jgi:DNA-binding FadR family transcriptional regulator